MVLVNARTLFVIASLSMTALALPNVEGQDGAPERRSFSGSYSLALGWSDFGTDSSLMAGVVTCGGNFDEGGHSHTTGLGGSCAPTFVDFGEIIHVEAFDVATPEVRFMACVDGDFDGVCRPEFPNDRIYIEPCNDGNNVLDVQHNGAFGVLDIYVLNGVLPTPCLPRQGSVWGWVERPPECSDLRDNDGDGAIDYPLDPDCDGPFDTTERPPQCRDGIDNDNSGRVDWPADPGCTDSEDDFEWSPECSNLKDDDGDGRVDGADADCSGPGDNSERVFRGN